jgi:hypothetical protein
VGGVSIAVMNWVWANSLTSGNERLVLLALAECDQRTRMLDYDGGATRP